MCFIDRDGAYYLGNACDDSSDVLDVALCSLSHA